MLASMLGTLRANDGVSMARDGLAFVFVYARSDCSRRR
jgi:hypothetical protein